MNMWITLYCASFLIFAVTSQETKTKNVPGEYKSTVTLQCDLAGDRITWKEYQTNSTHGESITRLQELEGGEITVLLAKGREKKYELEPNALKVKNFAKTDVGTYECISGSTSQKFRVTGLNKTECSQPKQTTEGSEIMLTCQVEYSGNIVPELSYTLGSKPVKGEEFFDDEDYLFFGIKYRTKFEATADLDKKVASCHVIASNDYKKECSHTLDVLYTARDIQITPEPDMVYVGDNVNCTARGNPAPTIIWDPEPAMVSKGQGWKSFKVTEDMITSSVTYSCMAYNQVNGKKTDLTKKITFKALERPTTTPEPTTTQAATEADPKTGGSTDGKKAGGNGVVVGAILGVVAVLILIVIIVVYIQRRKRKQKENIEDVSKDETTKLQSETTNGKVQNENSSKEDKLLQIDESEKRDDDVIDKV